MLTGIAVTTGAGISVSSNSMLVRSNIILTTVAAFLGGSVLLAL